jgi:hypothetical protein
MKRSLASFFLLLFPLAIPETGFGEPGGDPANCETCGAGKSQSKALDGIQSLIEEARKTESPYLMCEKSADNKGKPPKDGSIQPYSFHHDLVAGQKRSFGDGSVRTLSEAGVITKFNDSEAGSLHFSKLLIQDLKKIAPDSKFDTLEETSVGATANLMLFVSPRKYSQMVHDFRDDFAKFDLLLTVGVQQRALRSADAGSGSAVVRQDTGFGKIEVGVPVLKQEKQEARLDGGIYFQANDVDLGERKGLEETTAQRNYAFAGGSYKMILGSPAEVKNFVKLGPEWTFTGQLHCTLQEPSGTLETVSGKTNQAGSESVQINQRKLNGKVRTGGEIQAGVSRESRFIRGTKHRLEIYAIGAITRNPVILGPDKGNTTIGSIELGARLKMGALVQRSYRKGPRSGRTSDGSIR